MEINGIKFTLNNEDEEQVAFATRLASVYNQKLKDIVAYMLQDEDFTYFYGNLEANAVMEQLNKPEIELFGTIGGSLSYCNHTLDSEHIITMEFKGEFENILRLGIDG